MKASTYWLLFIIAAVLMFFLLGAHLLILHFSTITSFLGFGDEHPLRFASVMARGKSVAWLLGYAILLLAALYHGLYGLRTILLEVIRPQKARALTITLVVAGSFLYLYGMYAIVANFVM